MIRARLSLAIALLLGLVAPAAAVAQALRNHDSSAPIDFAADRIEVQDRADRAVLSGSVHVTQGGLTLDSARLTVAYTGGVSEGSAEVSRLDASGGVTVRSATETARGQFAIYDVNKRMITMIGGVELLQGASRIKGGRMTINLDTGRASVDGASSGGARPEGGAVPAPGGRVTGRFSVPKRDQ